MDYAASSIRQLQKAAAPAASLQETGASRQAPVAKKRKTGKRRTEATTVAPTSTEALAMEGTVEASSQAKPAAKARSKSASKTSKPASN